MASGSAHNVTQLLIAWNGGDQTALEQLVPLVHAELHRLARKYMGRERAGHVLQPSALVNEAYIRLIDWKNVEWKNRAHFFGVSAQLMRRILVDFARQRPRLEGRTAPHVSIDEALTVGTGPGEDLVAIDDALTSLAQTDERKSRIVELRFFGGLSVKETAEVMQLSEITVIREWNKAKAWLYRELSKES
ncbi:MAG TPA: sigma-70 family RNA polymerase sigma factor [Blastocatellia bacterium]|jgi:RNA polymerase sigma factor (TIGR02999 family)|nr:sigma-70 family RNA polymerase sigma factor [Blastocatellia bacterium]